MKRKYFIAWIAMVLIAIVNGTIREVFFKQPLGDLRAHQLSVVVGSILFGTFIWMMIRRWKLTSVAEAVRIGLQWLVLTVAFEFLFGHFVAGNSWERLLNDYNIFEGRLWIVILIWVAVAPVLFYKIQRKPLTK
jgi:hypothetical protein